MKRAIFLLFTLYSLLSCTGKTAVELGAVIYAPRYAVGYTIYENGLVIGTDTVAMPAKPERVVCMSSTYVAYIDALGLEERIVGVSGAMYISSPSVQRGIAAGRIPDVGYDTAIDYEQLVALHPDLVFIYGIGGAASAMEHKLRELGIPYLYMPDYQENAPLGKAEWVVLVGEIFGVRDAAKAIFDGIAERYEALKASLPKYEFLPRVMLNAPYRDVWFVPTADSYMAQLVRDAGGQLAVVAQGSGASKPISSEQAYAALLGSQYWLNPNQYGSLAELAAALPKFADIQGIEVYNCTLRTTPAGGSDFWESGALRADLALRDIIAIFHPDLMDEVPMVYFKKLW